MFSKGFKNITFKLPTFPFDLFIEYAVEAKEYITFSASITLH